MIRVSSSGASYWLVNKNTSWTFTPIIQSNANEMVWRWFWPRALTLVVSAVQMCSMTSVHPPAGAVLQSTVAVVLVVVLVDGTELHAVVRRVELVAGVIAKVEAIESISGVATKVVAVRQAVFVGLWSNSEHVVVGIPGETRPQRELTLVVCNLCTVSFFFFKRKPSSSGHVCLVS